MPHSIITHIVNKNTEKHLPFAYKNTKKLCFFAVAFFIIILIYTR